MRTQGSFEGIAGILLAAGKGTRFDPSGGRSKLLQQLPGGEAVAVAAARNLLAVLPRVIAVVRPDGDTLARELQSIGCNVTVCPAADEGMAVSLVHALKQARDARSWLIALADMPYVQPKTIRALAEAIQIDAQIVAPVYRGRRGNPVAFGREHLDRLLQLRGDEGARRLLKSYPVVEVEIDDPGIIQDIDTIDDLQHKT